MKGLIPRGALPTGALPTPFLLVGESVGVPGPDLEVIYRTLGFTRVIARTLRF